MTRPYARPKAPHHPRLKKRQAKRPRCVRISPIMVMAPLAMFTAVLLFDGGPPGLAAAFRGHTATGQDFESGQFGRCHGRRGYDCVIDGDSLMYHGRQIRVADIDTPELGSPKCREEAELGAKAKTRLQKLLNAGKFTLEPAERTRDRYGRELFVITRGGESLGQVLVREGLAHEWHGRREGWCG